MQYTLTSRLNEPSLLVKEITSLQMLNSSKYKVEKGMTMCVVGYRGWRRSRAGQSSHLQSLICTQLSVSNLNYDLIMSMVDTKIKLFLQKCVLTHT